MALRLASNVLRKPALRNILSLTTNRNTCTDLVATRIGNREIVGYGWNGSPCYADMVDYPFPAIRFREPTEKICKLREKEMSDWKKLTIDEKKLLYRYSFCQTFSEMKAHTPEWKLAIGVGLWSCALGILLSWSYYIILYPPPPETFDDVHCKAQLKRIIGLQMNPVGGLASKWDYDNNTWK